jgi:hypothetical protein
MEVAQTMIDKQDELAPPAVIEEQTIIAKSRLSPGPPSPRAAGMDMAERRRSSYERYSAITLPPLKEEKTPTPTPAATISKGLGLSERVSPKPPQVQLPGNVETPKKVEGVYRVGELRRNTS